MSTNETAYFTVEYYLILNYVTSFQIKSYMRNKMMLSQLIFHCPTFEKGNRAENLPLIEYKIVILLYASLNLEPSPITINNIPFS